MDTSDFRGCVALQRAALDEFRPDVLIGSSFGGAVAVALLNQGDWSGPTLLLAQAALRIDPDQIGRLAAGFGAGGMEDLQQRIDSEVER